MKRIEFSKIKVGDYLMAVREGEVGKFWKITYFKVHAIDNFPERLTGLLWVDFDKESKFIEVLRKETGIGLKNKFYKMSEKEFYTHVGKFIITEAL